MSPRVLKVVLQRLRRRRKDSRHPGRTSQTPTPPKTSRVDFRRDRDQQKPHRSISAMEASSSASDDL